ncbi:hypothetical protein [Kitasatospora aureofaciens]|uniref:hypothetical protein n=1 Tax=Kitasatospora aureofaciens TaxID=1894 RepID=UPI0033EC1FCE
MALLNSANGAKSTLVGLNDAHPLELTLRRVNLDVTAATSAHPRITVAGSNLTPSGPGVTVIPGSGSGTAPSCAFPAFPAL